MAKKAAEKTKRLDSAKPSTGEKLVVRFELTAEEMKERTQNLTRALQMVGEKEEAVKASSAVAKAEIKRLKSNVTDLANQLSNGYEDREVDVEVMFDRKKGIRSFFHHAPGQAYHKQHIKDAPMSQEDYALLPLETPPPAKDAGNKPKTEDVLPKQTSLPGTEAPPAPAKDAGDGKAPF